MEQLIAFILLGALGGVLKILLHTESLSEALSYERSKCVIVGAISGLAYYFLHTDYNLPNSFMALIAGYSGANLIDAGSRKLGRILNELFKP
jgi:ABC-type xylose transport system permease subunit